MKAYTEKTLQPSPLRVHVKEQSENEALAPFSRAVLNATNWYRGRKYTAAEKAFRDLIANYLRPAPDSDEKFKRDVASVIQAAAVVQQTM